MAKKSLAVELFDKGIEEAARANRVLLVLDRPQLDSEAMRDYAKITARNKLQEAIDSLDYL